VGLNFENSAVNQDLGRRVLRKQFDNGNLSEYKVTLSYINYLKKEAYVYCSFWQKPFEFIHVPSKKMFSIMCLHFFNMLLTASSSDQV
jgi:hypothetical protein